MSIAARVLDSLTGLVNNLSGLGASGDKAIAGYWFFMPLSDDELECAYRGSWMSKKAVDIPAFDMIREGWQWQAEAPQIEALERVEKALKLHWKVFEAQRLARLYGGAGIVMLDGSSNPMTPLVPERVRSGQLKQIQVLSRRYLIAGALDRDPMSPGYMEPIHYEISRDTGSPVRLHPSRVVRFEGPAVPDRMTNSEAIRWGDSVLDAINASIRNATSGEQGIAALIQEAKIDVVKVPSLTDKIGSTDYENRLLKRFTLMSRAKSMINTVIIDGEEEWEQKAINFGGLTDAEKLLLQIVSGAADIPATRFLGQSPLGMNATGESDLRNYYDRLASEQELFLRDRLDKLFDVVIPSTLGSRPSDIHFDFEPLWQLSDKEKAEVGKLEAETDQIHVRNATVPLPALETAIQNRLIEGGLYPGIEGALEEFEASGEEDDRQPDAGGNQPGSGGDDDEEDDDDQPVRDAAPRTLFVQRKLLNADAFIEWAKGQGFATTVPADELHVTVAFSRNPVDWIAVGQDWAGEPDGTLKVNPGGPRVVERLGPQGAVVLMFASSALSWRHEDIKRAGASWDWPEYQPHVTITFDAGDVDVDAVEPFQGELRFGPEIFEEVDDSFIERLRET